MPHSSSLYTRIRRILESARSRVARSVNTTQVVANWLIGREIVEEEQKGRQRAGYGMRLLVGLAQRLRRDFGAGYSLPHLKNLRAFYLGYPQLVDASKGYEVRSFFEPEAKGYAVRSLSPAEAAKPQPRTNNANAVRSILQRDAEAPIRHTVRGESWSPGLLHPNLSWSHYRTLMRVDSTNARAFYEIEAIQQSWSARELERHSLRP